MSRPFSVLLAASKIAFQFSETVLVSRRRGWTWGQIGTALGVSRRAAQKRYGPLAAELDQ